MQHSAPSSSKNSHRKWTNHQYLHLNCLHINYINRTDGYTTLNIPAVSHNYHRKCCKIDKQIFWKLWVGPYHKWSVHVCLLVCLQSFCVGWQCFMRGKETSLESLDYESSAAQLASLKWGTERLYDTFVDTVAVTGGFQVRVAAVNILHHRPDLVTAIFPGFIWHFSHAQRPVNKIES